MKFRFYYLIATVFVVVIVISMYGTGTVLDMYVQDLNCEKFSELSQSVVKVEQDVSQTEKNADVRDPEKEWRDAMLASILDDLFWLGVFVAVACALDIITGSPA